MYTVAETPIFTRYVGDYWTESERQEFCQWLAQNAEAGRVIPGSGGCRKVRWSRDGMGKRGGVRVIYYNLLPDGTIWLLTIYSKSAMDNIAGHVLKQIAEGIHHADE